MHTTGVPTVKVGFFPLDGWLKLRGSHWTPETIKGAVRVGVGIPSYRQAAETFEAIIKVPMSKSKLQELTTACGSYLVEKQAQEAEATVKAPERDEEVATLRQVAAPDSEVVAVSFDGAMINIRKEGWKEVKIATFSAVEAEVALEGDEEKEVRLTQHSYRAGLWEAKEFAKQQWAEGCRRGVEKARQIACVADGALWIWMIVAMCYAPCIEIIDWWHAVEKLWLAGNALFGQGKPEAAAWVEKQKDLLWAGKARAVLHAIRQACPRGQPINAAVWATIIYIFHNRRRMDYKRFRHTGYPIGSGSVESACKVVVQQRMKQAGMRWSRRGAQAMLALRGALLSHQWDEVWDSFPLVLQLA